VNAPRQHAIVRRWPETMRWGACFALALFFHVVGVAALLAHWTENSDLVANAPVITIDLAPLAVAPDTKPNELPPGPQQAQVEPEPEPDPVKPVEKLELPPEPQAEPLLAVTPPEAAAKAERGKTQAAARKPPQRTKHRREQGRACGGAGCRRLFAQPICGTELEVAAGRHAGAQQALSV
jgi:hypothetical protein